MTGQNFLSDIIRFHCAACRAELTVPATMAGVEGPCPSCSHTIQAPIQEAMYAEILEVPEVPWISSGVPMQKEFTPRAFPFPAVAATPHFPETQEKNFKARLAIPTHIEPLDDSWKARHRDLRRQTRRVRKVERVAQSFLDSRAFRIARIALILASAGMLVWLFNYMQNNQWRLPGMASDAGGKRPAATSGASRPLGSDANIFAGDDDTEIPPAASFPPGPPASAPLAASPR